MSKSLTAEMQEHGTLRTWASALGMSHTGLQNALKARPRDVCLVGRIYATMVLCHKSAIATIKKGWG